MEAEHGFITAVDVTPANVHDGEAAPALIRQQQERGLAPVANVGDMAYSAAELRQRAREQGTEIVARMPPSPGAKGYFPKDDFHLDLDEESVTCPAGHTTQRSTRHSDGGRTFFFNGKVCAGCPLRSQCTRQDRDRMLRTGKGRSIAWHALEPVLQAARAAEATPGVQKLLGLRWMVEQGIAHLMRRGHEPGALKGPPFPQSPSSLPSGARCDPRSSGFGPPADRAPPGLHAPMGKPAPGRRSCRHRALLPLLGETPFPISFLGRCSRNQCNPFSPRCWLSRGGESSGTDVE